MNSNLERARALIAELTPDERRQLRDGDLSEAAIRTRQVAERNEAIRAARRLYPALRDTPAAEMLASEYRRYLAGHWGQRRHLSDLPNGSSERTRALHRIARASQGQPIGKTTIWSVISGLIG